MKDNICHVGEIINQQQRQNDLSFYLILKGLRNDDFFIGCRTARDAWVG